MKNILPEIIQTRDIQKRKHLNFFGCRKLLPSNVCIRKKYPSLTKKTHTMELEISFYFSHNNRKQAHEWRTVFSFCCVDFFTCSICRRRCENNKLIVEYLKTLFHL